MPPRRVGPADDVAARGERLEKLDDHRVERLLADGADPRDGAGEALEVHFLEVPQKARGELGADRGQDDRRLLDRGRRGAGGQPGRAGLGGQGRPFGVHRVHGT
jgi:hypothetical protein